MPDNRHKVIFPRHESIDDKSSGLYNGTIKYSDTLLKEENP